jgi:hypothetical protein
VWGRTRQRQQLAKQREIVFPRARHEQPAEFVELGSKGVVVRKPSARSIWLMIG